MYDNIHPNLDLTLLLVRTEMNCGKGLLILPYGFWSELSECVELFEICLHFAHTFYPYPGRS